MSVVHCQKEPFDVKIDRTTIWGNPYSHKEGTLAKYHCDTRQESIEKYKEYILNTPELLKRIPELQGKILGCWCKPKACHGDFLVELANKKVDLENL
jgi:hypothetical protein|tara:strand:+ start:380 stop:670 length:291 start_codon:yes stop_codon:yes gene_type:complete